MDHTEILIHSFNPLNVTLPKGESVIGKVRIVLPDIHIQVRDLSMGFDLLKGAHLGADIPVLGLDFEVTEPVEVSKLMSFLIQSQKTLEEMWKLGQKQFDEQGALLG